MSSTARELVMAVLCRPLSGKELQLAEKASNVIIHRKIEYAGKPDISAIDEFIKSLRRFPLKLMFIFGLGDCIVVNHPDDFAEVGRRLLAM
ncbi:MAG TPA: hypothetical protein VGD89_02125 [Flavipsychrobacter sp.]